MEKSGKNSIKFSLAFIFLSCGLAGCAHAQRTINLSTDENVLERLAIQKRQKFDSAKICIERPKEWENIIVVGFGRYDAGYRFDGAFVNSTYYEMPNANLSKIALEAIGWKKANRSKREELALFWVEKGLLVFSDVLYTQDKDFTEGNFHPPQSVSTETGEVTVTLWTSVMLRKKSFRSTNSD